MPQTPDSTIKKRYHVTNLYGMDYLIDENSVVVLQAGRGPSVTDLQGIAKRYNQLEALREASKTALDKVFNDSQQPAGWVQIQTSAIEDLRAALSLVDVPTTEEGNDG